MSPKKAKAKEPAASCGCELAGKPVVYKCQCEDDCSCSVIEFDKEPKATPYCCGVPMRRVK